MIHRLTLAAGAALLGLAIGATPVAAATPGALYESFSAFEIDAVTLDGKTLLGEVGGHPTNISLGADGVYWQDGINIWKANFDLSNPAIFHTNNFFPTDFAVDVAHNALYESFSAFEIDAVTLDGKTLLGEVGGHPTNVSVGADGVYWQDGVNIWKANFDLSNPTIFHTNNFFPTDFAVDVAHNALYESFSAFEIDAVTLDGKTLLGEVGGHPTNISLGNDGVYWQDGINIWKANFDLSNPAIFHTNNFFPTDFAVQSAIPDPPPPPPPPPVGGGAPEPAAWALMLVGFGALGGVLRLQRSPKACRA